MRSALAFGGLSLVCAYVNYMKAALNGDNFYPQDLAMVSQAGDLTSFVSGNAPRWFWLGAAVIRRDRRERGEREAPICKSPF